MMFSWLDYVCVVATTKEIPSQYRKLRVVQLAQAILESARGTSNLFRQAGNPNGMKYQEHIDDDYAEKITHQIWLVTVSEPNGCYWCQWKTAEQAVMGYWRFIARPNSPYEGWKEYDDDPEGYLRHIWKCGYATDPDYVSKVKNVFPEAQSLLDKYSRPDPQRTFKVAIMPGHGGHDSGAVNNSLNLREKDYNWKEAVEIKAGLEAEGNYQVIICRKENELASLPTLQKRANDSGADVCLCLHHNATKKHTAEGWWLFYVNRNSEFEKFIKIMDKHFRGLPIHPRGYEYTGQPFTHDWHKHIWNCIHSCKMPTILFENCFIDNNSDALWLRDGGYQQIVEKICAGVKEYLDDGGGDMTLPSLFVRDQKPPANVRSGPGMNYDVVGHLDNGTALTTVGKEGNWLKISKPIEGYIHASLAKSSYCAFVNDPEEPLNIRSGPGTNYEVVAELMNGTCLNVIATDGKWLRIDKPVEGYVFASLTSTLYRVFVDDANPPLKVRSGPGTNYEVVNQLDNNTTLTAVDSGLDNQGKVWYCICSPCSGWVLKALTSSDPEPDEKTPPPSSSLSESEKYDYCWNIIARNGGHYRTRNIISFRNETSTKANNWKGRYDDITYMIWKDSAGNKHACSYKSNTEPSSQYEDSSDPRAVCSTQGVHAGGDERRDLGRLPEGYYEYQKGTSAKLGKVLRPISSAIAERDTNHNGLFESHEPRASAGRLMLFHKGGTTNPYSAGCQTMPPSEYNRFWGDLGANPGIIGYTIVRWRSLA